MKKVLPLIVAIIVLALTAAVAVQMQQSSALRNQLRVAEQQLAESRARAEEETLENERLRAAQASFAAEAKALRGQLASGPASVGAVALESEAQGDEDKPAGESKTASMPEQWAKMFKDPEMKKAMRTQQSFGIRMMYGELAKELGLSGDEADQMNELLTDRQLAMSAQGMELMASGADEKKVEELGAAADKSREDYDKQIANVLGSDRYPKFQQYETTMGDRMMLKQYQDQFAARGTPLEDGQREQLLAIMGEERLKAPQSPFESNSRGVAAQMNAMKSDDAMAQQFENQKQINARILDRASALLSPEQVNALRASQDQMMEMQQMGMKMGREMFKRGK